MIFISHRGNLIGKNKKLENNPEHVLKVIEKGFDVEIDVWFIEKEWFLGHDKPEYKINEDYLLNNNLWCHAKNLEALYKMLKMKNINCFWHQEDDFVITSKKNIWTYPGKQLTNDSIAVLPEYYDYNFEDLSNCFGICSDNILEYKEKYK